MKLGVAGWKRREGSGSRNNVQLSGGALCWRPCCGCRETPRVQKTTGWIRGREAFPLTERSLCSARSHLPYSETSGLLPPATPNNTCLPKSGFPLRDLRGCRQLLVPWGLPGTTHGLGGHPPRAASSPSSIHRYYNKCTQGLKVRCYCSPQPHDPTISQEKPPLSTRPLAAEFIP